MKTKILVLHLKEVLCTAFFACLGILLIIMICLLFLPSSEKKAGTPVTETLSPATPFKQGDYDVKVTLGDDILTLRVTLSDTSVESISFVDLSEECETMYPLLLPSLYDIEKQLKENPSIDEVVYPDERKYTSLVLISAIKEAILSGTNQ